jgi:enoyl-CoA hydratase/carnithine racemase
MARLPRVMGRGRALEVLLSSDDIGGADAEFFGYVNRALPDAELESFVGPPLNAPGAGSRRPGLSSPAAVLP